MHCTCCLLTPGKNRQMKLARLWGSHGQRQGVTPQPGARPLPARQQSRMPICISAAPFPIRDVWSGDWRELEVTPSTNRVATQLLLLTQPSKQPFHAGQSGFLMTLKNLAGLICMTIHNARKPALQTPCNLCMVYNNKPKPTHIKNPRTTVECFKD